LTPNILVLVKTCESLDESERSAIESRVSTDQKRKETGMWTGGDGHIKRMGQQHDVQHPWPGRNSLCMGSGELPTTMWPATACSCLGRSKNGPDSVRRSDVVSTGRGQSACRDHTDHQTRAPASPSRLEPSVEIPRGGLMSQKCASSVCPNRTIAKMGGTT
jgi:hypothetical protein